MRRFLHLSAVALAMLFVSVSRDLPPSAHAQTTEELERHLESTDRNVQSNTDALVRNWALVNEVRKTASDDDKDLAVLEGKIGLLETIGGAILLAVLANLGISWKGKAAK